MLVKVGPFWINPTYVTNIGQEEWGPDGNVRTCIGIEMQAGGSLLIEPDEGLSIDDVAELLNANEELWIRKLGLKT